MANRPIPRRGRILLRRKLDMARKDYPSRRRRSSLPFADCGRSRFKAASIHIKSLNYQQPAQRGERFGYDSLCVESCARITKVTLRPLERKSPFLCVIAHYFLTEVRKVHRLGVTTLHWTHRSYFCRGERNHRLRLALCTHADRAGGRSGISAFVDDWRHGHVAADSLFC